MTTIHPSSNNEKRHNPKDEELAQRQQKYEDELTALVKLDAIEMSYYPEGWTVRTSHAYQAGLVTRCLETIRRKRIELAMEDEVLEEEDNDEVDTPPNTTLPFPPSPNISVRRSQPHFHLLPNQQHPPDILLPQPFPPSPNILTRPHLRNSHHPPNHNSPDILAPLPLPLKPNISV